MTHIPAQAPSAVLVELTGGQLTTTSLDVAAHFGKRHDDVLKRIRNLDCSPEFTARNFAASEYTDPTGRTLTQYRLTRDGFTFLCMGFTGKEAARWKEAYIEAFNRMEALLRSGGLPEIHYPVEKWLQSCGQRQAQKRVPGHAAGSEYIVPWMLFEIGSPTSALLADLHRAGYEVGGCLMELEALRHHLSKARDFMRDLRSRSENLLNEGVRLEDRGRR